MIGSAGLKTISLPKYRTIIKAADKAPSKPKFLGRSLDLVISQENVPKPIPAAPNVNSPLGSIWLGRFAKLGTLELGGLMAFAKS